MTDEKLRIENAKITGTSLGICDHGIMTFYITLEGQGWGQGLGGYAMDSARKPDFKERDGWGPSIIAIRSILETVGVDSWEKLQGQLVRVKVAGPGSSRPPIIGNIIKDKWFDLKEFCEANKP